jgi:hypothetical protein
MAHPGALFALMGAVAVLSIGVRLIADAYNETGRRILRGLRKVLGGDLQAFIIDYGRGCGIGFNFASCTIAAAWDVGAWCRLYRIDELAGVELLVDGQVAGWAFADRQAWTADEALPAEKHVVLRHMFDDPRHPQFMLELWSAERETDDAIPDVATAIEKGNSWLDGMAALMSTVRRDRFVFDKAA